MKGGERHGDKCADHAHHLRDDSGSGVLSQEQIRRSEYHGKPI
nr:MAG TPA: hypothetical protein [Caudoviricetes sp.]